MPNIVVIGASAGGVEPLREIVRSLPPRLPAAVFVVMHLSASSPSALAQILSVNTAWKVTAPTDGESIEPTRIQDSRKWRMVVNRRRKPFGVCFCRSTILMRSFLNNRRTEPLFGGLL